MSDEHPLPLAAEKSGVGNGIEKLPRSAISRVSSLGTGSRGAAKRRGGFLLVLVIVVLTVGLAAVWTFVTERQLVSSIVVDQTAQLHRAGKAFELARTRTQANLQAHCRILVEDPRLKATLATEGMDAATVVDILTDLGKLRGTGFLMVLSPEGRVFAESGAPELQGLDLSTSSIVKKAQSAPEAAVGSWVLGGKVMDLSIMAIRYGTNIFAYLVVGESVSSAELQAMADQTGVHVASALGSTIAFSSTEDAGVAALFARVASAPGAFPGQVIEVEGKKYITAAVDLAETAQSHRLLLARSLASAMSPFELVKWLLFVPPLLVLITVLFSMSASRSLRRK